MENRFFNTDVLFNVLSRLSTKILLVLKCVSKGWHQLISDRSFIQAQLQKQKPIVLGFIFQGKYQLCNEDIKTVSCIPVVESEDEVEGGEQVQQKVFDFLPEDVVMLASCNGLVCCRSCFPAQAQDPAIYVCNPSNKEWIKLKSTSALDNLTTIGLVFDPTRDPVDSSTKFKLVRVRQLEIETESEEEEDLYYTFEVYSSKNGASTQSNEVCHCNNNLVKNKSVYVGGTLHWLTDGDKVLTNDVEEELSWLIWVPVPTKEFETVPHACIGDSEGRLHYIMIPEKGLRIWFLEDNFEFKCKLDTQSLCRKLKKSIHGFATYTKE